MRKIANVMRENLASGSVCRSDVCVRVCVVEWKWKWEIALEHFHAANKDDNLAARRKIMKRAGGKRGKCSRKVAVDRRGQK